jgi:acetyl-CoA C-acetyltransferase
MTENLPTDLTSALATAADADYEGVMGLSFVAINALVMKRYLFEYGWEQKHFAGFSINAHANAMTNPYARLHQRITELDYEKARPVAIPINLLDASPIGDGAAALYLVPADSLMRGSTKNTIVGSACATDTLAVHSRKPGVRLRAAERSARLAYAQAGKTPAEINLFEYHDAFSIMAALSLEASGFIETGQGPRLALDGLIGLNGKIPVQH